MRRLIVPSALAIVGLGAAFILLRAGTPVRPRTMLGTSALPGPSVVVTERARVRAVTLADGLVQPWALAFLPNGDMLITERAGRLRLMHDGRLASAPIGGLPPVDTRTQDGLMDLALHPRFAQNQILYFTYSKPGERGDTTALATAKFDGATLTGVRDLFVADAATGKVVRKITSTATDPHYSSIQFIYSAGAWDAASRRIAIGRASCRERV